MRILHIVTYMGRGGLETMLMNYYRHIDRSEIQFDFLVHRYERADYDDEIEALGGRIFRLPRLIPWSLGYKTALDNFFNEHPEYRIVHVHQDCLSAVFLKAAKQHGIPVRIAHSHNSSQDKNLKYPIKLFYRQFITKYATDLFACGYEAGEWMFQGSEFHILTNAIDSECYRVNETVRQESRRKLQIPEKSFVVGHVGRFSPQKNHAFLLDVFVKQVKKNANAILLLVGDGDLRPQIEKKAVQLGIANKVIFTGVRSDVSELLQAMDVFIFPSHYEGLPVTLIEAQASGLHCLISDNISKECDITDLISRLSLNASPEQWADELLRWKNAPRRDTSSEIKSAGFDIEKNSKWLENYYLEQWKAND